MALLLAAVSGLSIWFCWSRGYILYYGDAQAHLNISRSIIDARNPGYDQIGTVWLPLLHVLCLPLAADMGWWSNGLAGALPVAMCFVVAGVCCFLVARSVFEDTLAAFVALACFATNPNMLYLGSIPMTEAVFLAGVFLFLLAFTRGWIVLGILASWCMSLTRYDGWFLIPFEALWFARVATPKTRLRTFLTVAILAGLAPLYWTGHCWWETGNGLDFFNGPYSAKAIQGGKPYPGFHDWATALTYYAAAGRDCAGWPLIFLGVLGTACALARQKFAVLLFLFLTPAFYVWSLHSSGTPIFVRELWPHGLYNTRYGIAVVALTAFAAGAIIPLLGRRWRIGAALAIPVVAVLPWIQNPSMDNVICWKESEVNSIARRAWSDKAAHFLNAHYEADSGILAPFGDLTGIFGQARIPLKQVLHEGAGPLWDLTMKRPDLLHTAAWGITQRGTRGDMTLSRTRSYTPYISFDTANAPSLDVFHRTYADNPVH